MCMQYAIEQFPVICNKCTIKKKLLTNETEYFFNGKRLGVL